MLKKRRRKRREKTNKEKQGRENYKENTGTKFINNTKKRTLKIQSFEFQNTMLKKMKKKNGKQTNKNNVAKIIKKIQVQN